MNCSYAYLYHLKAKKMMFITLIMLMFFIILLLSFKIKVYSSYQTYAVYDGQNLLVDVPLQNSDAVKKASYLKISNHKRKLNIKSISDLQVLDSVNFQTFTLESNTEFKTNEIVKITFYYDKQRIIQKIMKVIF